MDPHQDRGNGQMADANEEMRTTVVLGLHKLLPKVHQELFKGCKGTPPPLPGNAEWKWGSAQDQAFTELKRRMAEDVILTILNETNPFMVEADASEGAVGAVLSQKQNGKWRPGSLHVKVSHRHGMQLQDIQ